MIAYLPFADVIGRDEILLVGHYPHIINHLLAVSVSLITSSVHNRLFVCVTARCQQCALPDFHPGFCYPCLLRLVELPIFRIPITRM
jgi:hypothetical protein